MGHQPNLFGFAAMAYANIMTTIISVAQPSARFAYKWIRKLLYTEPRAFVLTYLSVVTSYADEYKMINKTTESPSLFWYPYWWVATLGYMLKRGVGVCDELLRQHYRDKTLHDSVTVIDSKTIEVTYEFKNKVYKLRLPIDRMYVNELIHAEAVELQGETDVNAVARIKQLLGPLEDWHQRLYTPECLGYKQVTIKRLCSDTFTTYVRTFEQQEVMCPIRCISNKKE